MNHVLINNNDQRVNAKFSEESLCSFLHSAKNIEFVYLILLGINSFMDNYDQSEPQPLGREKSTSVTIDKSADAGTLISLNNVTV
jgi:hypothetical protein